MAFYTKEDEKKFYEDNKFFLDFDTVISSLEKVTGRGDKRQALCPAHSDSNPSLSIKRGTDNKAVIFCHALCSYENIVRALGLWQDTPPKKEKITSKIVATYSYVDEEGIEKYQVVRYFPKKFLQRRPDGKNGWIWDLQGISPLLYNLPALLKPSLEPIFIVEGEEDVHSLTKAGAIATTNSGGGTKWHRDFNKLFAGRDVAIIPDNDVTGTDHAELVSKQIYRSASSVRIINLPSDAPKYDVSDYLEEGHTYDELLYLYHEVEPLHYTDEELTVDPTQSHNLEAEMAVLGAIFKNQILIGRAIENDLLDHYFDNKTKAILKAMLECFELSQDINYITVGDKLGKKKLEQIGGSDFLRSLEDTLPEVFDIGSWIKIIIAKSQYRALVTVGKSVTVDAETEVKSVDHLANEVLDKVYNIKQGDKRKGFTQLSENLENVIITAREAVGKGLTGIPTGLPDLDYITSGFQDTDFIIIAGRPSSGKTALGINIAAHAAIREGKNVGVFSLEMSEEQLITRIICGEAFVDSFNFKNGSMQENDWERIAAVLPELDQAGIFIDDTPGIGVTEMRSKALRLQQEHGLDLVVIDYLQLMNGTSRRENRQQEVSQISRDLKAMAKELKVPVVALSQLNRMVETRSNNRPVLSDLRESGSLEQDTDVVAFIYREEYYSPEKENAKGLAEVIVAKQRNGAIGTVELAFLKQFTRFLPLIER